MPGIAGALLDAGGDLMLGGLPVQGDRWEVHIDDPTAPGTPLAALRIGGGAISTSAATMNRWAAPDGSVVHHLIDPRTGSPADRGILQVTVAGPDPAWTGVWCRVLCLAGSHDVEAEARRRGLAAWWVERDGTLRMTPLARLATARTTHDWLARALTPGGRRPLTARPLTARPRSRVPAELDGSADRELRGVTARPLPHSAALDRVICTPPWLQPARATSPASSSRAASATVARWCIRPCSAASSSGAWQAVAGRRTRRTGTIPRRTLPPCALVRKRGAATHDA